MRIGAVLAGVMAMVLAGPAAAESAKTAVSMTGTSLARVGDGPAVILDSYIHVANDKDLVVDVSFQAGITTSTRVKSKGGTSDTSMAYGGVKVYAYLDGDPDNLAAPGVVTFISRKQTLSATLGGFETCNDVDGDGLSLEDCELTEEEISLILETMSAHSFNFVLPDLTAGEHMITVVAELEADASAEKGDALAAVSVGPGTVIVDEVRLTNSNDEIFY